MIWRLILVAIFSLSAAARGGDPWDRRAEDWTLAETYRILQDSPWSPATGKIQVNWTERPLDPLTHVPTAGLADPTGQDVARGVEIGRAKPLPGVSVLWWSSKTLRLAQQRLRQLRHPAALTQPLRAGDLPDYVLVIESGELLRILRDAREDLRDIVFLEIPGGTTLDLGSARFIEGSDEADARVEFHFPRQVEGRSTVDSNLESIVFHCKALPRTLVRAGRTQFPYALNSLRAECAPMGSPTSDAAPGHLLAVFSVFPRVSARNSLRRPAGPSAPAESQTASAPRA